MSFPWTTKEIERRTSEAVASFWEVRGKQAATQKAKGKVQDAGTRGEVTGGKHLDAFRDMFVAVANEAGFKDSEMRCAGRVEVPGYYRPTKKWDMLIVRDDKLCALIETKGQVGSFGKNFNNRSEEAIGSAMDIWRTFEHGTLGALEPFVGYFLLLEDHPVSTRPIVVRKSVPPSDIIFDGASYARRYEILCDRLMLDRKYTAASVILAPRGTSGEYREMNAALGVERYLKALYGHLLRWS